MECIHSAKLVGHLRVDRRTSRVGLQAFNGLFGRVLLFATEYTFAQLAAAVPTFVANSLAAWHLLLARRHLRRLLTTP